MSKYMMKKLLATVSLVAVTATPALADTSKAFIEDHYKTVLEQKPYNVEVCKDIKVPQKGELNTEGAIIGGIIGGVIGNQFGKGSGKEAATGVGGMGGASMTTAYTVVLECYHTQEFLVYFGGTWCYTVSRKSANIQAFVEDCRNHCLESKRKREKYQ